VPDIPRFNNDVPALFLKTILPDDAPALLGANVTLKDVPCPDASVNGAETPDTLNPAPLKLTELIDAAAVPTFVTVTDFELLAPIVIFPNATDEGFALSCALPGLTAIADSGTDKFLPCVSVVKLKEPLTEPAAVGANFTVAVTDWDGVKLTGVDTPETLNPAPSIEIEVMLIAAVPTFDTVTLCDVDVPTVIEPKAKDGALELKVPEPLSGGGVLLAGAAPTPQPTMKRRLMQKKMSAVALTRAFAGRLDVRLRLTCRSCTLRDSAYKLPK
jgi:hypothetical protein